MSIMTRLRAQQEGSLALAMLVVVVVAGLITVIVARTAQGQRTARFDRDFTEALHVADAGVNQALFQLNEGVIDKSTIGLGASASGSITVDGETSNWTVTRDTSRRWKVTSTSVLPDADRTVVAELLERPRFFNGAFGDEIISLNGSSSNADSYSSVTTCSSSPIQCGWGPSNQTGYDYGTGNASLGTNETFQFQGNPKIRPLGATLYDWDSADAAAAATNPFFGDRCKGNPCGDPNGDGVPDFVLTNERELDFAGAERMQFITDRVGPSAPSGACSGGTVASAGRAQELGPLVLKNGDILRPYEKDPTWAVKDPQAAAFQNYYCADSIQVDGNQIQVASTADKPVVIFVRDFLSFKSQSQFGCHDSRSGTRIWCNDADGKAGNSNRPKHQDGRVRPPALKLQMYFLGGTGKSGNGKGASDISLAANAAFAGIIYAPRSVCAGGNGNVDIYGAVICGSLLNVGNWGFHYDDALSGLGNGEYDIAFWSED